MNRFVILWSLISPGCVSLIASVLWFYRLSWYPGYPDIWISIAVYLAYWLPLGVLQGVLLFWKFRDQQFAYRWFLTTTTTGVLVMLSHDLSLALMGVDTRGQGALILILSLPCLAALGGPILGLAQFLLIRNRYQTYLRPNHLTSNWFARSFLSWAIGFTGILIAMSTDMLPALLLLVAFGSALKGWFIQKHLRV
ncbi:hypothetical protein [Phormidesmis sp. 146-33]